MRKVNVLTNLEFTLVFSPLRMPKIQIVCLFILYKPQTVVSILARIELYSMYKSAAKYNRLCDIEALKERSQRRVLLSHITVST